MSGFLLLCSIAVALGAVCAAAGTEIAGWEESLERRGGEIIAAMALVVTAVALAYLSGRIA